MSLTVIAIASLHAALPWIAGQQTKKMRWVVVATCIACYAALVVGNGAYVLMDLVAAGVGFFIGRAYVTPRSKRKQLWNQESVATCNSKKSIANLTCSAQTISHPSSEGPEDLSSAATFLVVSVMCFAVAVIGLLIVELVTGTKTGEFVIPTFLALFFLCWVIARLLGLQSKEARGYARTQAQPSTRTLEAWVRPKNVMANRSNTKGESDQKLYWPPQQPSKKTDDSTV